MEQQSISNFLVRPSSSTPQSSSHRGSKDRSSLGGPSGSSSSKGRSVAPSEGPGGKKSVVSAVKERDRGGGGGGGSSTSSPSLSRSSGPSSLASSSKSASSSDGKRKREPGSAKSDLKGKGKAREIIELDDSDDDKVKKEEHDVSDLEEIEEPPVKKRKRLSALPLPTSRKVPPPRHHSSASPTCSSPPPATSVVALPPEKKAHRRPGFQPASPPPAPEHLSSPPPRDRNPPRYAPKPSAFRSSPPQLSASLAPYLPANHPSPPSLYRPTSTQEIAEANQLTGLKDGEVYELKYCQRARFDHESDYEFAERKGQLKVLEDALALKSMNNSMRPKVREGLEVGGLKYLEEQRRAAEADRESERKEKKKKEEQKEERERERQAKKLRRSEARSDHQDASPFVPSLSAGPSNSIHQRDEAPNSTPTVSSSRRLPASRPRHNLPLFALASTPVQHRGRLSSPPMPPPSRLRPAPPSPPMEDAFSLTESQFPPLAAPPPAPAHESPSPSFSPPPPPPPPPVAARTFQQHGAPPRLQLQHPSSDDVGDSQWSAVDYYNPDPPRNPFVDHPIPLSDLLPINPTIAGMNIPDPEEYETQFAEDGIPESQYGESAAGWSAFEAVHVHRPGRIFEEDPSRSMGEERQVGGAQDAEDESSKEVASDDRSLAPEKPPQQDSSQTQPSSSQSQIETALQQPPSPDVFASRVLVEATPSPTSARSSSPPRDALLPYRPSVSKPRPPLQPRQLTLLHQREPSSPSQDPSSGESIAFVGRSPGSIPVREFTVAKDDSSSGPGSSGIDELEEHAMTPKGQEARRAMLEEVEGEGFKVRFEHSSSVQTHLTKPTSPSFLLAGTGCRS